MTLPSRFDVISLIFEIVMHLTEAFYRHDFKNCMPATADIELRSVVKFCVGLKLSIKETLKQMKNSKTLPTCVKAFVYKLFGRFQDRRTSLLDDIRPGRPLSTVMLGTQN